MNIGKQQKIMIFSVIFILTTACTFSLPRSKLLGRVHFSDAGGYEVQLVNDYTFQEFDGGFELLFPGSEPLIGPGFIVLGGLIEGQRSNEEFWNLITQEKYRNYQFDEPKARKVDSISGFIGEYQGIQQGKNIKGKLFLTMVAQNHEFMLIGFSPEDEWKKFEPNYDMVLKSVNFYIPNRTLKLENPYKRDIRDDELISTPYPKNTPDVIP